MAAEGNKTAHKIFQNAGKYIGRAASIISNSFNPERIIIGGELAAVGDILYKPICEEFYSHLRNDLMKSTEIVMSSLGGNAKLLGGVVLSLNETVLQ